MRSGRGFDRVRADDDVSRSWEKVAWVDDDGRDDWLPLVGPHLDERVGGWGALGSSSPSSVRSCDNLLYIKLLTSPP